MQPISPAGLIHQVGTALFGSNFQHDLATALDVNRRTVARWVSGEIEPRAGVWSDLLRLIEARRVELGELVKIVASRVEPGER
jgi:predicted transcriptional regulator